MLQLCKGIGQTNRSTPSVSLLNLCFPSSSCKVAISQPLLSQPSFKAAIAQPLLSQPQPVLRQLLLNLCFPTPSCCHSNITISISAASLILHCDLQCFSHGALALLHIDEELGLQFLCPRISVLPASDPLPPTVRDTASSISAMARRSTAALGLDGVEMVPFFGPGSNFCALEVQFCQTSDLARPPTVRDTIVVLAGGRHCCIGLGGVGFVPSNEDLAFRDSVCHLMNLFLRTMFKLRQGPVQFLGLFLATEQEEFFLKRPRIWNHFGSFFWAGNSTR